MTNPKWEIGPVKLVNGWDATIYRYCENRKRYIGEVKDDGGWFTAAEWRNDGRWDVSKEDFVDYNLAPLPKKTVRVDAMWVVVYRDKVVSVTALEELAKSEAYARRALAIKKIEPFEVTEGEGL